MLYLRGLAGSINISIYSLAVNRAWQWADRAELALDDLTSEQRAALQGVAIQHGDQEASPEGVTGAGSIRYMNRPGRDVP
jgi:hypothetical protein